MKQKFVLSLVLLLFFSSAYIQNEVFYRLFDSDGKKVDKQQVLREIEDADIIFFGEMHNDVIGHYLELEVLKHLYAKHGNNLVMGCEMFEADDQVKVSEYTSGLINDKTFETEARLWKNYESDYKPLFQFARKNSIETIATNIPRRYASLVYKGGFEALDSLNEEAYQLIAPLPIAFDTSVSCYQNLLASKMPGHGSPNLAKSQAIKDATMAHFILKNWNKGKHFYHFNGAYHSKDFEGIVWYLKQAKPNIKIKVITTVDQDSLDSLDAKHKGSGDYLLVTHPNFPKSY